MVLNQSLEIEVTMVQSTNSGGEACREFEQTPRKETLMSHEIPYSPWQKIAADRFTFKNKEYLVTV